VSWTGLFAPARTPPAVIEQLNQAVNAVLAQPEVRARLQDQGATAGSGSAEEFGKFVASEQQHYAQIVKAAGIRD